MDAISADTAGKGADRRIDVGRAFRQELFLGALLPTVIGVAAVVAALVGATEPDTTATRTVAGVLGAIFLAVGAGLYFWLFARTPQTWLDVGESGIAVSRARGLGWQLAWDDITNADVVRTRASSVPGTIMSGNGLGLRFPRYYLRLKLTRAALHRPEIHDVIAGSGSGALHLDLGVPGRTAREVLAVFGPRLDPRTVTRIRKRPG